MLLFVGAKDMELLTLDLLKNDLHAKLQYFSMTAGSHFKNSQDSS
jgi:hypothetical protein